MFDTISLSTPFVTRVLWTLVAFALLYIIKRAIQHLVSRYISETHRQYRTSKLIGRLTTVLSVVAVIMIWSPQRADVFTLLTLIGAGLAISMREALLSMLGWLHLIVRTPYKNGDRIEVRGIQGDVVDVRLLHTTLMEIGGWVDADQSTGRLVHIPNHWVFLDGVYNYTLGFNYIWNELPFTVTFRSDWQRAQEQILDIANETVKSVEEQASRQIQQTAQEYLVHYSILTPYVYVNVVENGIRLTLRYLCEPRKRRGTAHALTVQILKAFQEAGTIELAYPMVGVSPFDTPQFGTVDTRGGGANGSRSGS